jgi:branched-chain amino acid transport system permease protein
VSSPLPRLATRWSDSPYLPRSYRDELRLFPYSIHRVAGIAVLAAVAVLLPVAGSTFVVNVVNFSLIAIIGAIGLQLVTGMAGQLSLGHAAFLATGAFTAAALHLHLGAPFVIGLPLACVAGGLMGLVAGLPALRLRGLYLGITTLAVQSIVLTLALRYQLWLQRSRGTGADLTVPDPDLGLAVLSTARSWYAFLLPLAGVVALFCVNLRRSTVGRDWIALRKGEVAAEALGVDVRRRKVQAFVVSSVLGALAGALGAYYFNSVTVENFSLVLSVEYLAMIIIGGLGLVLGAVLGAAFLTITPYVVGEAITALGLSRAVGRHIRAVELGIFALITIAFLLVEPEGLAGLWRRVRSSFERWPYRFQDVQRTQR